MKFTSSSCTDEEGLAFDCLKLEYQCYPDRSSIHNNIYSSPFYTVYYLLSCLVHARPRLLDLRLARRMIKHDISLGWARCRTDRRRRGDRHL